MTKPVSVLLSFVLLGAAQASALPALMKLEKGSPQGQVLQITSVQKTADKTTYTAILGRVEKGRLQTGLKLKAVTSNDDRAEKVFTLEKNPTKSVLTLSGDGRLAILGDDSQTQRVLTINTLSAADDKQCLTCDWNLPALAQSMGYNDSCENLYEAACLNHLGQNRYAGVEKEIEKRLQAEVDAAKSSGARQLGYATVFDALKKGFASKGLILREDISAKARAYLQNGGYSSPSSDDVYENVRRCNTERTELGKVAIENDVEKLKAQLTANKEFNQAREEEIAALYAADIPNFVDAFRQKCTEFKNNAEQIKSKGREADVTVGLFNEVCGQRSNFRQRAIDLYRAQDEGGAHEKTMAFMRRYAPLLNTSVSDLVADRTASADEAAALKAQVEKLRGKQSNLCSTITTTALNSPRAVREEVNKEIGLARATVESIIERIYTPEREKKAVDYFTRVRQEAMGVAQRVTQDPEKLKIIRDHYSRMRFNWLTKPAAAAYKKDPKTGLEKLDLTRISQFDLLQSAFGDGDLSFFTTLNAFYMPDIHFGADSHTVSVTMMPVFIDMLDSNPFGYLSVAAHEAGHNIGPRVARGNGYDLTQEYAPLVSCLESSDSLRMQEFQQDETIADFVSAEIMSSLVSQMPLAQRRAAINAGAQPFCMFAEYDDNSMNIRMNSGHPESILRVANNFGANRSIRQVLSCDRDARQFRTCSLEGGSK